ncbi:hypothetical protein TEHN7126_2212 [Tetragenococcus halophilus subsp. halophilus]|uniref:phage head-tail connector protein n=1 Tax=Tetragenococcus halophilus TaxID=51669 RepID=UPI000CAD0279|nr:phage head-tail connector protein [Tetragenococcus halophilus]GBD74245.1 hypothetical protein TEHN7125_2405 [Tetragenococcus halophilus subsp. halophilus]GBD76513.1 hypothetical protein TEHN7126_2212 [Tetragenococcus halophilus subsp. halophilus]
MARTILDRVKTRTEGMDISEDLLEDLIEEGTEEVLSRTNQEEMNKPLEHVVVGCVLLRINQLGVEGVKSESYSGVSTSYFSHLPNHLQTIINRNSRPGKWKK